MNIFSKITASQGRHGVLKGTAVTLSDFRVIVLTVFECPNLLLPCRDYEIILSSLFSLIVLKICTASPQKAWEMLCLKNRQSGGCPCAGGMAITVAAWSSCGRLWTFAPHRMFPSAASHPLSTPPEHLLDLVEPSLLRAELYHHEFSSLFCLQ